jgi:hypothetical protein
MEKKISPAKVVVLGEGKASLVDGDILFSESRQDIFDPEVS